VREILERDDLLRMPPVVRSREVTLNNTEKTPLIHEWEGAIRSYFANRQLKGKIVWNSRALKVFDNEGK
jgi:hypothetical protein